jgi:hypothetical protein
MAWPEDQKVVIKSFAGETIKSVELLGSGVVEFEVTDVGLEVTLPDKKPCIAAYTLNIKII